MKLGQSYIYRLQLVLQNFLMKIGDCKFHFQPQQPGGPGVGIKADQNITRLLSMPPYGQHLEIPRGRARCAGKVASEVLQEHGLRAEAADPCVSAWHEKQTGVVDTSG